MSSSTSNPSFGADTSGKTIASTFANNIQNQTILITGVNQAGLGYGIVSALAPHSPKLLIITGRSSTKLSECQSALRTEWPDTNIRTLLLDLSSLESVRKAAAQVLAWDDVLAIDIIINNAGVMNIQERTFSTDGIEMHFATNHVGHWYFTCLVMDKVLKGYQKRIVNVSSVGTFVSPVRFSDINWEKPLGEIPEKEKVNVAMLNMARLPVGDESTYIPFGAYGMSKTANILFSVALNERLYDKYGVLSLAVHPGEIQTELQRSTDKKWLAAAMEARASRGMPGFKTVDQGTATSLVAALDSKLAKPGVDGLGTFLDDCQITTKCPPWSLDKAQAEKLWELSEELVGEKFAW